MKALITGIKGFVGYYLAEHLLEKNIEIVGTTRGDETDLYVSDNQVPVFHLSFNNADEILDLLNHVKPDVVFHLAGQSNVKKSWEDRALTFHANVNQTIYLLDACVKYQEQRPGFKLLTIGSSEEYGKVESDEIPIKENTPLRPMSPYGASKAAVSMLIQQYYKAFGLHVTHARPFNHIGPRQSLGFVVPDFANQIAQIEKGINDPSIKVGNLEAIRDFTDVKDIVLAYLKLVQKGHAGEVYNVCSGNGRSIKSILDKLIKISCKDIEVVSDQDRLRPSDVPAFIGCNNKLRQDTEWEPNIAIENSLINILDKHRNK
jgi:GDP-4-dehydro-6-deoxy-D-mannose reductase